MNVPWGQKAFKLYLGEDQQAGFGLEPPTTDPRRSPNTNPPQSKQGWKQYDATELVSQYKGATTLKFLYLCFGRHKLLTRTSTLQFLYLCVVGIVTFSDTMEFVTRTSTLQLLYLCIVGVENFEVTTGL